MGTSHTELRDIEKEILLLSSDPAVLKDRFIVIFKHFMNELKDFFKL